MQMNACWVFLGQQQNKYREAHGDSATLCIFDMTRYLKFLRVTVKFNEISVGCYCSTSCETGHTRNIPYKHTE